VRFVILRVSQQHAVHIRARVLEEFVGTVEDDQRNLAVAQHTQFVCFLHEAEFTLRECHLHATDRITVTSMFQKPSSMTTEFKQRTDHFRGPSK